MKDIKEIIANNLVELRKENNLTQNDLAKKLMYSDNTISRWEHAEITPNIETLQKISEIYNVSLEELLKENIKENNKNFIINRLATSLLSVTVIWFIAIIVFIYSNTFSNITYWMSFIWSIPVSCLVMLSFRKYYKNNIYGFIFSTLLIWTLLLSIYLQFIEYNVFLIFIVGIPLQAALSVWTFVKKK